MVPNSILKDVAQFPVYVLALGDPGQLPPISSEDQQHLLDHPHIFLDEIHRQAQESEIIRLSMDIRAGKPLQIFRGQEAMVLSKKDYDESMLLWADQILVATNATRVALNTKMRQMLGYGEEPQVGDKLICLKNEWNCFSTEDFPLVNGTVGYLSHFYASNVRFPSMLVKKPVPIICGNVDLDYGGAFVGLSMDRHMIDTGEKFCDWRTARALLMDKKTRCKVPLEFTYGYAITVWKFQGSSAGKILGIEEGHPYDRVEHQKYLYTMVTRAENKIVIIKKD